jgi:hypothetical protein
MLGMLCAAELYVRRYGLQQVICAKLHHQNAKHCIFALPTAATGNVTPRSKKPGRCMRPTWKTPSAPPLFGVTQHPGETLADNR